MSKPIGVVVHYYDKIGVAVIKFSQAVKVGDMIKVVGKQGEFIQEIESMQEEHKQISEAKKGQEVGLKVDQIVKKGDLVFKSD